MPNRGNFVRDLVVHECSLQPLISLQRLQASIQPLTLGLIANERQKRCLDVLPSCAHVARRLGERPLRNWRSASHRRTLSHALTSAHPIRGCTHISVRRRGDVATCYLFNYSLRTGHLFSRSRAKNKAKPKENKRNKTKQTSPTRRQRRELSK